ncbi:leucine-rich repeat protein [Butyricicoccus sp.]|uniref:leucine-rich repeat protein n=1 Tax=Butyricicoccus sp. TaxID=2049021 RepID=UPI003F149ECA
MKKKLISLLLTGCMAASMLPAASFAADVETPETSAAEQVQSTEAGATVVAHGSCGTNANWTLDSDGILRIIGTGGMTDYIWSNRTPWYSYRSEIKAVEVQDGITSIGSASFSGCTNLKQVSLGTEMLSIGTEAFKGCTSLTSITIPEKVTSVGQAAFNNCTSLNTIYFNAIACKNAGQAAAASPGFKNIGSNASVIFGDKVTRIPGCVFQSSNIVSVKMPNTVTEIGESAFSECSKLTTINMSTGLKSIGFWAFKNCSSLTSITIPASVTSIGTAVFIGCTGVTEINYQAVDCSYTASSAWPVLFQNAGQKTGSLVLNVGEGVKKIPAKMFQQLSYLTKVNLPLSLQQIGDYAFYNCGKLTELTVYERVKTIGTYAFGECGALNKIYFRGNAPTMGSNMFHGMLATAYYPTSGKNWSDVIQNQYGGIITWNSWTPQNVAKELVSDVFTDVPANAWYVDVVQFVYDNGLMQGTSDTTFSPQGKVNRAMVVQILYNKAGNPAVSSEPVYTDVKAGTWYFNAVQWASKAGVASGVGGGKFNPTGYVTREQLATMLYNDCGKPSVTGSLSKFEDSGSVSSWAKTPMIWATTTGVMSGYVTGGKTYLKPLGQATRAEAASMLKNYLSK